MKTVNWNWDSLRERKKLFRELETVGENPKTIDRLLIVFWTPAKIINYLAFLYCSF